MYLIYGKGKVGLAIARLCEWNGIAYELCDDASMPESYDIYECIIPSPGIPGTHVIYSTGKVISELDFAYRFLPKDFQIISVTGTDGKSTTSWIMYNILEKEFSVNKSVYLSGNFDVPFSATVLDILKKGELTGIIVLEMSSFMAFSLKRYQSNYSIFTNFKPDHLNWHKDLQEYLDAKMNLMVHTNIKCILNQQVLDFISNQELNFHVPQNTRIFSLNQLGADSTDGNTIKLGGNKIYSLSDSNFSGKHNAMNILSCLMVADEMNIPFEKTYEYLKDIQGLPHRLEVIASIEGITIVEDSKSTSAQSLAAALSSFGNEKNLLLIVGGSDKGDNFGYLESLFLSRVKALVAIGATKNQFLEIAQKLNIPNFGTDNLSEGTHWLFDKKQFGDVLMLSPGCASFGLFTDYLDRANQFREIIKKLPQ